MTTTGNPVPRDRLYSESPRTVTDRLHRRSAGRIGCGDPLRALGDGCVRTTDVVSSFADAVLAEFGLRHRLEATSHVDPRVLQLGRARRATRRARYDVMPCAGGHTSGRDVIYHDHRASRDGARSARTGRDAKNVKKYILFDHDGVLVDTEFWYFTAGQRALAEIGVRLDKEQYLRDMSRGAGTWEQARAAGIDEQTISRQRELRNAYYREYLRTEAIEIEGVVEALAELSAYVRMAIVTTAKRADFELIHEHRSIRRFMDFVLVREDYELTKPHPEPYVTGLKRLGATKEETLVVEDSSRGLSSAVAAGIDCVIVHNDFTKAQDFSQADYRIKTLSELKDIVLRAT